MKNNLPVLTDKSLWTFRSENLEKNEACKNGFWNSYLDFTRQQPNSSTSNLVNCNSPSLVRISKEENQRNEKKKDEWVFLVSDPAVTHAHLERSGDFFVADVDYLSGVYQMVAENVVLKKVVGENCLG